jgi:hypothetical protein
MDNTRLQVLAGQLDDLREILAKEGLSAAQVKEVDRLHRLENLLDFLQCQILIGPAGILTI